MDRKVIQQFIETFMFLQQFNCFDAIDQMFVKMIKEDWDTESLEVNKQLIVTFCRANALYKTKIPHYQDFLDKACSYLKINNCDPKSLLHGIL